MSAPSALSTLAETVAVFVSDGAGVCAEGFGETLLTQFSQGEGARRERFTFVRDPERAHRIGIQCAQWRAQGARVVVFSTLTDPASRAALDQGGAQSIDLFALLLPLTERSLDTGSTPASGLSHGGSSAQRRQARADAVDYALAYDDGGKADLSAADIILVGVSRSGKTPTCLWLAFHYGLKAANYPLTPDDFEASGLPACLQALAPRCVGLTLSAERLSEIRSQRLPGSRYASRENCAQEIESALALMRRVGMPLVDTTGKSVEEIAAAILPLSSARPSLSY